MWDIHSPQDFSWQTEKPRRQQSPTLSASFHKASFGLSAQVPGLSPASCSTTKTSFFLQGLSSDLITFSGHSLISESFLPRTPVRPCLPHIFSFSLQNTEHDIPRCAHAFPVCSVLFHEGLGCSCTFSTLESTHRGLAVFVPWVGSCPHSCELQQQTLSLSFNCGFLPPPLSPERSMSCPQV